MMISPLGEWESFPVAAIFAYFDESESELETHPAVAVGGFISTGLHWVKFAREWNAVLDLEGVDVFHATDLETEEGRRGTVYEGWPKAKREKFQSDLLAVIRGNLYRDLGVGITRSVFDQVMTADRVKRHGDIYKVAALMAMFDVIDYSINHFKVAPSFTVEKGGTYYNVIKDVYDWLGRRRGYAEHMVNTTFSEQPKSRLFPHLQAADYLVFNFAKTVSHLRDSDLNPATVPRIYRGQEIRRIRHPLSEMFDIFGNFHISRIDAAKLESFILFLEKAVLNMKIQKDASGWRIEPSTSEEKAAIEFLLVALSEKYAHCATAGDSCQATYLPSLDQSQNTASSD